MMVRLPRRAGPLTALLLLVVLGLPGMPCLGEVTIEASSCRMVEIYDAGTVRLLLQNNGDEAVRIEQVRVNGRDLQQLPNDLAVWWRMAPELLAPQGRSVLSVRLSNWLDAPSVAIVAETDSGVAVGPAVVARKFEPSCDIAAIRFGPGLRECYVYLRNDTGEPVRVLSARVNDVAMDLAAQAPEVGVVPPDGGVTCLPVSLPSALAQGDDAVVDVGLSSGNTVFACVRAFRSVPVQAWHSDDQRPEMKFDPWDFFLTPPVPGAAVTEALGASADAAYVLMKDPATADYKSGKLGTHAAEVVRRWSTCRSADPTRRAFLLVTQYCRELAYLHYGQLPDLLAVSPDRLYKVPGSPPSSNEYYFNCAREAAAPAPFAAVLETRRIAHMSPRGTRPGRERWITPLEHELNTSYAMGAGAAGYFVFHREGERGYDGNRPLTQAVAKANARIQRLKPLLSVASPCRAATCSEAGVACRTLLVGNRALLVLLINQDIQEGASLWEAPKANPHADFVVHVSPPSWLGVNDATDVDTPSRVVTVTDAPDGELILEVDGLVTQRTILLHSSMETADEILGDLRDLEPAETVLRTRALPFSYDGRSDAAVGQSTRAGCLGLRDWAGRHISALGRALRASDQGAAVLSRQQYPVVI